MMVWQDRLLQQLATFADLGTDPPRAVRADPDLLISMTRHGDALTLTFLDGGRSRVIERWDGGQERTHASYRALLASDRFADLRRWADIQRVVLSQALGRPADLIPIEGAINQGRMDLQALDTMLTEAKRPSIESVQVLLIDGPAGIGKTVFIEHLALRRASHFKTSGRPLILHVQSRGRNLSFIQDLMAFSLQTLRLDVTYDQLPVLVQQGLVILAIDGFDELGDPTGYDLAWGQLNELVGDVRGEGTLILAGRETFIGRDRLLHDVRALSADNDIVNSVSLLPPAPNTAKQWLRARGWKDIDIDNVEELFEPGSYALRPFFLARLAEPEIASEIRGKLAGYPVSFLVDRMIEREASKFGDTVDNVMDRSQRIAFIRNFLRELARDMADNQTESIDEVALSLLTEIAAPQNLSSEILGLLKNRAAVMAFLAVDDRPRFRRFAHSQLQYHFLAEVTVGLLSHGEVPKYIRRNILGPDFLITFSDVVAANGGDTHNGIHTFVRSASDLAHHYLSADRGSRNLAAILIAALPVAEQSPVLQIEGLEIDDAVIKGTAAEAEIIRCTINQLDARAADISNVKFDHTQIVNLIGDNGTRLSSSFPDTYAIQDETPGTEAGILNPDGIREWLDIHGRAATNESGVLGDLSSAAFQNHPLYRLLGRACRYKAYWIRSDESDIIADRILNDPWWSELEETLDRHGLIRKEYRHASGRASQFFHIKRKTDLLDPELGDSQIAAVFKELKEIAERMASRSASP